MTSGDSELIAAVDMHIQKHVGPVAMVFHEIVSDELHIDIHHVAPAPDRPFHALITSGMSEVPMNTGPEAEPFRYAELVILLESGWDVRHEAFADENNYWPVRLLKDVARYPVQNDTWVGYGHSISGHDPPRPFAPATELSACVLLPPLSLGEGFSSMDRPDGADTYFWTVLPLYVDELQLKIDKGADALIDALGRAGIDDIVRQSRPHAGARKRWLGLF